MSHARSVEHMGIWRVPPVLAVLLRTDSTLSSKSTSCQRRPMHSVGRTPAKAQMATKGRRYSRLQASGPDSEGSGARHAAKRRRNSSGWSARISDSCTRLSSSHFTGFSASHHRRLMRKPKRADSWRRPEFHPVSECGHAVSRAWRRISGVMLASGNSASPFTREKRPENMPLRACWLDGRKCGLADWRAASAAFRLTGAEAAAGGGVFCMPSPVTPAHVEAKATAGDAMAASSFCAASMRLRPVPASSSRAAEASAASAAGSMATAFSPCWRRWRRNWAI